MQNNDNQKTHFIYVRSTGEKVPVTKEQHDPSIWKPTAFATRSRTTAGACAHIASYGDAMATALTVNITLLETSPL